MGTVQFFFYAVLAISTILVVIALAKGKHTAKHTVLSATYGVCALGAVNILSAVTGISITVNYLTCFMAAVLSLPGVAMLVILQLLFSGS